MSSNFTSADACGMRRRSNPCHDRLRRRWSTRWNTRSNPFADVALCVGGTCALSVGANLAVGYGVWHYIMAERGA